MCLVFTFTGSNPSAVQSRKRWVMHVTLLLLNMFLSFCKVIHFNLLPPKTQCHATFTWTFDIVRDCVSHLFWF